MPESARCTSRISPGVVADDGADRDLRRDVAGHALADARQPLLHEVVGLALDRRLRLLDVVERDRRGLDVGGDVQHLLEALALVQVLREPQPGAGDAGQRRAPPRKIARVRNAGRALSVTRSRPYVAAGAAS